MHLPRAIRFLWRTYLGIFLAMAPAMAQTPVFTSMDPQYAQPGDSVTLYGSGFDILETYSVSLQGVSAAVEEVQAGFLRFTVPAGASTAPVDVEVGTGGPVATTGRALTVLRPLTTTFHAGLAAVTTAYDVGTLYGDAPLGGPSYPVLVVQGNPTMVIGAGDQEDSNLLAIATDTSVTLELSAHSTAVALVFLTPYGLDGDPTQDDLNLSAIGSLAEVSALATLIETATLAGQDYGEDPGFDAAYLGAVLAYLATIPPPGTSAPPPGGTTESAFADGFTTSLEDFTQLSPQDLFEDVLKNIHPLDRMTPMKSTVVTNNKRGVTSRGVTFPVRDASRGNPVDWVIKLYELDPEAFISPGQFSALLNDGTIYSRLQHGAVSSLHVSATLNTAKIDIIARLRNG